MKNITTIVFLAIVFLITAHQGVAQTITIVGTPHINHLQIAPNQEQLEQAIAAMSAFEPTQVCVEMMSGERIEMLNTDPSHYGRLLEGFASAIVWIGTEQQRRLEIRPAEAREEARKMVEKWDQLNGQERGRLIRLQLAGFEFASAALNWSYLTEEEQEGISAGMSKQTREAFQNILNSTNEVFTLAVPLAKKAGLHEICSANSLEDEVAGVTHTRRLGYDEISQNEEFQNRIKELRAFLNQSLQPESGPDALVKMLKEYNSEKWAATDRELQWETLHMFDNEKGATIGRLMYWHARTSEINAELYRALAQGPDERVLFIVGASHRPFNEEALRSQPWVEVKPAVELFK